MYLSESLTLKRLSSSGWGKRWAVYFLVELLRQNVYSPLQFRTHRVHTKEKMMAAEASQATHYHLSQLALRGTLLEMREDGRLFSLLKRAHLLPNLPETLQGLTFPELLLEQLDPTHRSHDEESLTRSHPFFAALNRLINSLEEHQEIDPLLREIGELYGSYIDESCAAQGKERLRFLSGPVRLFAFLHERSLFLFSAQRGENVTSIGHYSGDDFEVVHAFDTCDRSILEKIFPQCFFEGVAALVSDLPKGTVQIEEVSLFGTLQCWTLPHLKTTGMSEQEKALEQLFLRFPDLIRSEEFLHLLAEQGSYTLIRFVACQGANFNLPYQSQRNRSPLHSAAVSGQAENIRAFIECGAEIDAQDLDGRTPLHLAILYREDRHIVDLLLKLGANPNVETFTEETPLHLAVARGDSNLVLLLLEHLSSFNRLASSCWVDEFLQPFELEPRSSRVDDGSSFPSQCIAILSQLELEVLQSAIDLALRLEKDEIVRLLLFQKETSATLPQSLDSTVVPQAIRLSIPIARGQKVDDLFTAVEREDLREQIFCLVKRAYFFLKHRDYWQTVLNLNSAYAVAQDDSIFNQCRALLLDRLERVEASFIHEKINSSLKYTSRIKEYRSRLQQIREEIAASFRSSQPINQVL